MDYIKIVREYSKKLFWVWFPDYNHKYDAERTPVAGTPEKDKDACIQQGQIQDVVTVRSAMTGYLGYRPGIC